MKLLLITSLLINLPPAFGLDDPAVAPKGTSFFERFFAQASVQPAAAPEPAVRPKSTPPPNWPDAGPRNPNRPPSVGSRLKGEYRVTAAGAGRAVLRPSAEDSALRIVAEFGAAEAAPAEGTALTLTADSGYTVTRVQPSAVGPVNVFVRADTGTEVAPPLSLKWGQSIDQIEKMLGNLRGVNVTRQQEGSEEVVQAEGALPRGMHRWLFGFGQGVLTRMAVVYEKPEQETASIEEKFRSAAEGYTKRYGEGERLTASIEGEPVPPPIRWKKPNTELTMRFVKTREGEEAEAKLRIEAIYAHTPAAGK
ncbi:MAG: hypothetical protein QOE70_4535 [Chthoniobacter sp.]|jgi:hypothetical protein|nr:hypothetical protein [Chthoniobacter sp.]